MYLVYKAERCIGASECLNQQQPSRDETNEASFDVSIASVYCIKYCTKATCEHMTQLGHVSIIDFEDKILRIFVLFLHYFLFTIF